MSEPYQPINCEFHDLLEHHAVRRTDSKVVYRDDAGARCEVTDTIADLGAEAGVEYMTLSGGLRIRLDRIESVNGVALAGFGG